MRKIITHTTSLVLHFVFAGLFFLTSCDNFLDGGNLKELLEKDIAYAESPFYEIHLECDDNAGTFTGSTNLKQKVTDIFSVEFKIKSGYRFSHWEAYSKKTDNSIKKLDPDYIEFISFNTESTDGLYKTDVRFIKEAADITIRPVCLLIPEIQDFYPPYNPSGYEQNSAIKITFNKPMDAETFADYSCISIYTESGSLSEYFENPHFNEDKTVLTVMPKESMNILTPDSGDKLDVSVYIDFTDIKDADGLPLSKVSPFTYRINDGLLEHQKVRLTEDTTEGTGVFVGFGEKECTTGYSIEVQFTVNKSEYRFEGLEAVNSNNEKIENAVWFEQISEDEESGTYRYKIYVNETVKDIKIRPVCTLLTSINVTITGSNGKFSPAKGEKKCTMTHTYPLSFEPDSDYEFIRWEIYNKKTNTPIENSLYINIADPSLEETSYSLKKAPEDSSMEIAVRPVIAERPQIISYSPMTSGVFKDSAIQIVFDRSMAPSSIYYTLSELNEIFGHDLSDAEEAANEPYKEIIDDTVVYYGYVKDGEVFFKNISIINNITKKNLNSCFTHPVFNNSSSI
ncbi:MAG: hypothetical protein J5780_01720, partial [Treponema sp.]|nr:hypothetical protein [Treponema sp.]